MPASLSIDALDKKRQSRINLVMSHFFVQKSDEDSDVRRQGVVYVQNFSDEDFFAKFASTSAYCGVPDADQTQKRVMGRIFYSVYVHDCGCSKNTDIQRAWL